MEKKPIELKSLEKEKKYPYFFKNENIDENTYIAQKATNVENALFIIDVWNREKYNTGEINRTLNVDIPHTKYIYNGNNKKGIIDVNGGDKNYKVLLYKKEEKINVIALLKFK